MLGVKSIYKYIFVCIFIFKAKSTARTVDSKDLDAEEKLKQSFTYTKVEFTSKFLDNIPADAEEVVLNSVIQNGFDKVASNAKRFIKLQSVKVIESFIGPPFIHWLESLENLQTLSLMNVSTGYAIKHDNTNISVIDLKVNAFKNLKVLTISGGNITNLKVADKESVPYLNLSGNHFECSQNFIWLLNLYEKTKKVNLENTFCFIKWIDENETYPILYSLKGKPFLPVVEYKREAVDNCPPKCICELKGMLTVDRPQLNVDCIGLNMTKLPSVIPKGSSRCNFSYNMIDDLTPLYTNRLYDKVAMMTLSHNYISFLDPIQFPDLLSKSRDAGFWLDHNRLKKFPAKPVAKVYEEARKKDRYMPQFFLGHNPWECECDYIEDFQKLIYQHMYDIFDVRDIRCSEDDQYNPNVMVLTLDVTTLCDKKSNFTTLDVLNMFLGILLIVLMCDFLRNLRQYRKNRKLPWIVANFKCC